MALFQPSLVQWLPTSRLSLKIPDRWGAIIFQNSTLLFSSWFDWHNCKCLLSCKHTYSIVNLGFIDKAKDQARTVIHSQLPRIESLPSYSASTPWLYFHHLFPLEKSIASTLLHLLDCVKMYSWTDLSSLTCLEREVLLQVWSTEESRKERQIELQRRRELLIAKQKSRALAAQRAIERERQILASQEAQIVPKKPEPLGEDGLPVVPPSDTATSPIEAPSDSGPQIGAQIVNGTSHDRKRR